MHKDRPSPGKKASTAHLRIRQYPPLYSPACAIVLQPDHSVSIDGEAVLVIERGRVALAEKRPVVIEVDSLNVL
jgi:hypothetical protein